MVGAMPREPQFKVGHGQVLGQGAVAQGPGASQVCPEDSVSNCGSAATSGMTALAELSTQRAVPQAKIARKAKVGLIVGRGPAPQTRTISQRTSHLSFDACQRGSASSEGEAPRLTHAVPRRPIVGLYPPVSYRVEKGARVPVCSVVPTRAKTIGAVRPVLKTARAPIADPSNLRGAGDPWCAEFAAEQGRSLGDSWPTAGRPLVGHSPTAGQPFVDRSSTAGRPLVDRSSTAGRPLVHRRVDRSPTAGRPQVDH